MYQKCINKFNKQWVGSVHFLLYTSFSNIPFSYFSLEFIGETECSLSNCRKIFLCFLKEPIVNGKQFKLKLSNNLFFWKGGIFRILQSTCTHISSTLLLVNSFKPFDMFHRTCCLGWSWISFHIYITSPTFLQVLFQV